eukprot:354621-Chlamydomonas_euryale.AAC.1
MGADRKGLCSKRWGVGMGADREGLCSKRWGGAWVQRAPIEGPWVWSYERRSWDIGQRLVAPLCRPPPLRTGGPYCLRGVHLNPKP